MLVAEGICPVTSKIRNQRDKFLEKKMKKLIITVAAIAVLSGPVYAKESMHNQMVHMMKMIKQQMLITKELENYLKRMMDNTGFKNG
jgi:radical SAM superfamily enzyme with C-terminal helix-hairpin-helix motif